MVRFGNALSGFSGRGQAKQCRLVGSDVSLMSIGVATKWGMKSWCKNGLTGEIICRGNTVRSVDL